MVIYNCYPISRNTSIIFCKNCNCFISSNINCSVIFYFNSRPCSCIICSISLDCCSCSNSSNSDSRGRNRHRSCFFIHKLASICSVKTCSIVYCYRIFILYCSITYIYSSNSLCSGSSSYIYCTFINKTRCSI